MAQSTGDGTRVNARILYWGIPGAGLTSNLAFIHAKLRSDHRGELRHTPTRLDPTVTYEVLPISLGEVNGVTTQLQITAVPSDPTLTPTRKQLLDEVDGVVLVIDSQGDRAPENAASVEELRKSLEDYGRSLDEIPLVVQYNKRDLTDDYQVEALHRQLALPSHAVFESMANEGRGVLKTLTTISKQVVRALRDRKQEMDDDAPLPDTVEVYDPELLEKQASKSAGSQTPTPRRAPTVEMTQPVAGLGEEGPALQQPADEAATPVSSSRDLMEQAILAEAGDLDEAESEALDATAFDAQEALNRPWDELAGEAKPAAGVRLAPDLRIVSVGTATRQGQRSVRVPLVLGNDDGETVTLALTVALDPILDD